MTDEELLVRVREMRENGSSPKQIARALGLRPSAVAPLVRQVASLQQSSDPAERVLLGCWISSGWSVGLGLDDAPEWAAIDPASGQDLDRGGLAGVLIARQERASRATICGFLVDMYCLGVKDALGPRTMASGSITALTREFFNGFQAGSFAAPLDLAQHLVHGAVAYARTLGFEPHPDFAAAAPYLGTPNGPTPIRFGRDGMPFYFCGPYDDANAVIRTLDTTAGAGNYHYVTRLS